MIDAADHLRQPSDFVSVVVNPNDLSPRPICAIANKGPIITDSDVALRERLSPCGRSIFRCRNLHRRGALVG